MWIILVMAGLVIVLAQAMRVESICSANECAALKAEAVEAGAIQYVLSHVDALAGKVPTADEMPAEAIPVGAGGFWIIRPNVDDTTAVGYGLVDEASKINLNTANLDTLLKLPGMTDELANAIIEWRGGSTASGIDPYSTLPDPYKIKADLLETFDELFLIRGATSQLIYGNDRNRNALLDAGEDAAGDGKLDRGLAAVSTVYSQQPNVGADGRPLVNVNDTQGNALAALLAQGLSPGRVTAVMNRVRQSRPFASELDFYNRSTLTAEEFAPIAGSITTSAQAVVRGRVNVNTAPREVLACLGSLTETDADALIARRGQTGIDTASIAWVTEVLPANKAAAIGGLITTRTYRFTADIVSVSPDGRAFRRCRIVVDNQASPAKVIYRQDLTHLGWPLDGQILDNLRSGVAFSELGGNSATVAGN